MLQIADGQIAPGGYFLIANYSNDYIKSVLDIKPDLIDTKISLSNEDFAISFRDCEDEIVDRAGDGSKPFFYSEISALKDSSSGTKYKASIERIGLDGGVKESWQITKVIKNLKSGLDVMNPENSQRIEISDFVLADNSYRIGSEKIENFYYTANQPVRNIVVNINAAGSQAEINLQAEQNSFLLSASDFCYELSFKFFGMNGLSRSEKIILKCYRANPGILFSEVLSAPKDFDWDGDGTIDSQDEWIELMNLSDKPYDLIGWRISDKSGKIYNLSEEIGAGEFLVLFSGKTKLSLNNTGEQLFLWDPAGELIDQIEIPSLEDNISFAKIGALWSKTNRPTPSKANLSSLIEPEPEEVSLSLGEVPVTSSVVVETEPELQSEDVVFITTSAISPSSSISESIDRRLIPKVDGSMVLGQKTYGRVNAFNFIPYLVYFTAVLFLFITSNLIYEAFYRRE